MIYKLLTLLFTQQSYLIKIRVLLFYLKLNNSDFFFSSSEHNYQEEKCQGGKGMTEITAGVLGGLLVFALILTLSVYRKWKIEQEIEGLLWKINPESLQGHREGLHSCASRQSLGSMISGKVRLLLLSSH